MLPRPIESVKTFNSRVQRVSRWKENRMRPCWLYRATLIAAVALVALGAAPRVDADTVLAGWDLFQTQPGTSFDGVDFTGVPIGTSFTFPATNPEGNPIVPQNPNLGATDTIIERTQNVTAAPGGSGTTPLIMQDLQLVSTASVPANAFFAGSPAGFYYITLQSMRPGGGTASTGTLTINFANPTPGPPPPTQPIGGTFSSTLDLAIDLRLGSLTGTIETSTTLTLTSSDTDWSHYPIPGSVLITNVNSMLDTTDHANDFFLNTPFFSVPEPSTLVSAGFGLVFVAVLFRRSSRKWAA
jgi:PEP-CTERM motif